MSSPRAPDHAEARAAAARADWATVRSLLAEADPATLTAADLEGWADAAWWSSRLDEAVALRQRTYAAAVAEGDEARAAYAAWYLWFDHVFKGDVAVASAWLARGARHAKAAGPCREAGLVTVAEGVTARHQRRFDDAQERARAGLDIGRAIHDADVVALATLTLGRTAVDQRRIDEGVALIDDAMCSVVAGELTPLVTGLVYCDVIAACFELADLRRAGEWTGAAMQWCETQPAGMPYRGVCRVHRVEVTTLHGAWADAEAEALTAADELHVLDPAAAGSAFYAIGEIRRRRGDLAGAEDAYRRAHDLGHPAEPGRSLLRLHQGRPDEAAGVLRVPLDGVAVPLPLALLLAARVEVAVAIGDDEAARAAATHLDDLTADEPGDTAVVALAALARARLLLAEDEPERASDAARSAWTTFASLRLPHEAAQARVVLGRACTAAGDPDAGRRELESARRALDELGAALDVAEVSALLGEGRPTTRPGGLTDREVEVLGLVAAGRTNREVAADLYLSEHTVARHLQNIFTKLDVNSRAAATRTAYEHGLL